MPKREAVIDATLPVLPVLIPLGVHFVLLSLVFLNTLSYLPEAYYASHLVLILVGLWACHDRLSVLPAVSVIVVVLFTILLDIVQLGLYFPAAQTLYGSGDSQQERTWQFAAGMSILNLLFKPITVLLVCVAIYVRAGGSIPKFMEGGGGKGGYERIPGSAQSQ